MNVFIGWSGETGWKVAHVLERWLSAVFGGYVACQSAADIDKGMRWDSELYAMLKNADCGVLCVTRDGCQSPWLFYEAGVLNGAGKQIIPVLFDVLPSELAGPLRVSQSVSASREGIWEMVRELRNALEAEAQFFRPEVLVYEVLYDKFAYMYPGLEEEFSRIRAEQRKENRESRQGAERRESDFTELDRKLDSILSALSVISAQPGAKRTDGLTDSVSGLPQSPGQ